MAWYKELQQYHMNQFTEELQRKLLKLAGAACRPAAPACCAVELGPEGPGRPALSRLSTQEEIPFELAEAVPARRPAVAQVRVVQGERRMDVGELLGDRSITFQPFSQSGGEPAQLYIGFSQLGEGDLRLWFDVVPPEGVPRNPFSSPDQVPRVIRWDCQGAEGTRLLGDDTHALSVSGYVTLRPEGEWPAGEDGLYWLTLTLEDPGCEEEVRLSGLSAGRYPALQQETWAKTHRLQAPAQEDWEVRLTDAQAGEGDLAVFLRTGEDRWQQTGRWQAAADQAGRLLRLDASQAAQDGADNVLVVSLDPAHSGQLLFDAKGLPGETFFLDLEGRTALTESFALLCDTLQRDGQVRPALWRCVEDLYACGPRDRVFTYDPVRETITFGDGEHGALLCRGKGRRAGGGPDPVLLRRGQHPPPGRTWPLRRTGLRVRNRAASGGADPETAAQARARLLRELSATRKCVCAADYERLARETPGLRVAAAKACPPMTRRSPPASAACPP